MHLLEWNLLLVVSNYKGIHCLGNRDFQTNSVIITPSFQITPKEDNDSTHHSKNQTSDFKKDDG
jgi:hypothetical protein